MMFKWLRKRHRLPPNFSFGPTHDFPRFSPSSSGADPDPIDERLRTRDSLASFVSAGDIAWNDIAAGPTAERMGQILKLKGDPGDPYSEWSAYYRILKATSFGTKELFIGLLGPQVKLVAKKVLEGHTYILGGSNTGKTSIAVTQLLIQLARCINGVAPPIFIFDLKPDGDRALRATAENLVRERHAAGGCKQEALDFFSNAAEFQSQTFDPWVGMQAYSSIKAQAQAILSALIPTRVDKSDAVFFLNENREILESVLRGHPKVPLPHSFRDLLDSLEKLSRGSNGNREARGVHGALSDFEGVPHVRTGTKRDTDHNDVDLARVFDEQRVMYIQLDTQNQAVTSKSVGRFMLFCLLAEARKRSIATGVSQDFYVFIDEFHEIASHNITNLATVARSTGCRFIFSHQSTSSLDAAQADILLQNTALQIILSPDDAGVIKALQSVAGEETIQVMSRSHRSSIKEGSSASNMKGGTFDEYFGTPLVENWSGTFGRSNGVDESFGTSYTEARVSALSPDMMQHLDINPTSALVRVKKQGDRSGATTPWLKLAVLDLIYPYSESEYDALSHIPWPKDTNPAQEKDVRHSPIRTPKRKPDVIPPTPDMTAELNALAEKETAKRKKRKKSD